MSFEIASKPNEPLMLGEEDFIEESRRPRPAKFNSWWTAVFAVLAGVLLFGLGVAAGKNLPARQSGLLAPEGDVKVFMEYNSTFTLHPSPESDAAWDSLFPKGKGFVKHPTIAPETSGIVVYHGLHCLNALREVYYAAVDGQLSHMTEEHDHQTDPHHVRHCFDYLRQSLMCSADTNLEPVTKDLKGVTGWGFSRTCRNLDSVKSWAEENWSNEL
ncbi:hypothetical protein BO78DRAFT_347040 [Aspergillus sclerotiicarbonarius CBS 121057]|uniref:Tat pathway signal sequence n=1 Tax=Aspergillus sclerotiicarbonarius (strain CBS 121057 / IBT 28362) TaxID=1448318 RepID=A0A319E9I4_ASPSB|nr:hypothetical protein BO78DRAFT_347040 [Aspergillus sclerotiicarbonarius CBS 121057]